MIELKKIKKSYKTGNFVQDALKGVDLQFRKNEFVAILGQSGSGKTTMLNILGGLDRYDSGDLIINNKSTKKFKNKDWDAYRNNCVGFIFQSYNLISHINVLTNVEMGMTLSGISHATRKKKAMEVLEKVGLKEHAHKKPNQLSGGQMQRVAIARALANDPDIILADEPTGALDSETSVQIMELIQEIAKDKLVVMVTHNPELAEDYATRVIQLKDGEIIEDSNPIHDGEKDKDEFSIKKTSMKYLTALKLSFNNIKTKKGRTLLTSFASSIGIIGIALILALSNGFNIEIDKFERDSLSQMPITISKTVIDMSGGGFIGGSIPDESTKFPDEKNVIVQDWDGAMQMHTNNITQDYIDYVKKIDMKYVSSMSFQSGTNFNTISTNEEGHYVKSSPMSEGQENWILAPNSQDNNPFPTLLSEKFDVLAGSVDVSKPGLILQLDVYNNLSSTILKQLGFSDDEIKNVSFDDIMNKEIKIVLNDEYYQSYGKVFIPNTDLDAMYHSDKTITVKVQAILRGKKQEEAATGNGSGVLYTQTLSDQITAGNINSEISKKQREVDYNVLTGQPFDKSITKADVLSLIGGTEVPATVNVYPKDFDSKNEITKYLDAYNTDKQDKDKIQYLDMASLISSLSGNIMSAITIVLIAFSAISLIVSSIMIGIITYISVLERTKEIGILRALGARKKDITRVFNAETFIIGLCSGLLGVGIAWLLTFPANVAIESATGLANVAKLNPVHTIILIVISMLLTLIGGFIPAKMAAKKDPVEALRSE